MEEIFPRHGSFPGFHPLIELSLTNHTQVVGSNGQRQAMYLEKLRALARSSCAILFFGLHDSMIIFSNSGVNGVVIDVALGAKARQMPVIGASCRPNTVRPPPPNTARV